MDGARLKDVFFVFGIWSGSECYWLPMLFEIYIKLMGVHVLGDERRHDSDSVSSPMHAVERMISRVTTW